MKQSKRILAYSALALVVMLAAFGAIAFDTSNVAYAQGPVPAAPTLTAQASGATTIGLSWNAVAGAARYELWAWDSVNGWDQLDGGSLTITSHSHTGLTSGATYYYQIRAVNSDGAAGGWSDRVNEVAGDMVPNKPVLSATAGYQQIRVSWLAVTGATRYELWAWDGAWTALHIGASHPLIATFHVHPGLTTGRTYYYQGRAVDSAGVMSAWSEQVSAKVLSSPNISAPTSFMAARDDQMVTLTWAAPASTAGLTVADYEYRYVSSGGTQPDTWMNAGNVLTASVSGLTNGTTYNFQLTGRQHHRRQGRCRKRLRHTLDRARRAHADRDRRLSAGHAQLGRARHQRRNDHRLSYRNAEHPGRVGGGDLPARHGHQPHRQRSDRFHDLHLSHLRRERGRQKLSVKRGGRHHIGASRAGAGHAD